MSGFEFLFTFILYLFRMSLRRWRTCSLMSAQQELPASPTMQQQQQHPMMKNTRQHHRKTNTWRSQRRRTKSTWRDCRQRRRSRNWRKKEKRAMQESTGSVTGGPGRRRNSRGKGSAWRELEESETGGKRRGGSGRGGSEPRWTGRAQMFSDRLIGLREPGEMKSRVAPALIPGGWDMKQPFLCLLLWCKIGCFSPVWRELH